MSETQVTIPTKDELLSESHQVEGDQGDKGEVQIDPVVERAERAGWVPKEKWVEQGHDATDWRDAATFLDRGDLMARITKLSAQVTEATKQAGQAYLQGKKFREKELEEALGELRALKVRYQQEGEFQKADAIGERIEDKKEELRQAKVQQTQTQEAPKPNALFNEWVSKNQWFNTDKRLQIQAAALAQEYLDENQRAGRQVEQTDVLRYVETEIRKEFPHKFQKPKPQSPDSGGKEPTTTKQSGISRVEEQMTEQEKSIMKTLIKSGVINKEDYLKEYTKTRG